LSNPGNATIGTGTGTGTITNDDAAPSLSIDNVTLAEGYSEKTYVILSLGQTGATALPATDDYATADVSATGDTSCGAGTDYKSSAGSLNFAAGDTSKTVTPPTSDNNPLSLHDALPIFLSNPGNATIGTGTGTGTITNDDAAPSLSIDNVTLAEGDSGTTNFTFTVSKTGATALAATVDYATADVSATGDTSCGAGTDYKSAAGSLNFAAGDTSKTVTVQVCGDNLYEATETFHVILSNPGNATIEIGRAHG